MALFGIRRLELCLALFSLTLSGYSASSFATLYDLTNSTPIVGSGNGPSLVGISGWSNFSDDHIQSAEVKLWGSYGLGIEYGSGDQHSLDNNGAFDSLLFEFSSDIILTDVEIGWHGSDADISILAYTGAGSPATLLEEHYEDLLDHGWEFIDHYADLDQTHEVAINTNGIASSFWLIGAYNPLLGISTTANPNSLEAGNDYLKLSALRGIAPPSLNRVPEPSSLFLIAAGLIILLWISTRSVITLRTRIKH